MKALIALSVLGFLCLGALISGFFLWRSWTQIYYIPSRSMFPTFHVNDKIIVDKRAYKTQAPKRGEVTVFIAPQAATLDVPGAKEIDFVMRVVAVAGDKFEIVKKRLRINGKWVADPGAKWSGPLSYDCKIVGGKVYSRDYTASVAGPWTVNNIVVPESQQKLITQSPTGTVPANQFLVLGDNRTNSNDSHVWGFLAREAFRGRVSSIIYPTERQRSF